jgi:hypothetical protein
VGPGQGFRFPEEEQELVIRQATQAATMKSAAFISA